MTECSTEPVIGNKRSSWASLTFLTLFSSLVGTYYFTGLYASDDMQYVTGAQALLGHSAIGPTLGGTRLTMSIPLALFIGVTGSAQIAAAGFIVFYVALVLLTYWTGRQASGYRCGIIAGWLVACCPLLFFYAGAILPDNILALAYLFHLGAIARLVQMTNEGHIAHYKRKAYVMAFCAGLSFGLCYATKEASIAFFIPSVIYAAIFLKRAGQKIAYRLVAAATIGCILVVSADALINWAEFGDPIIRLTLMKSRDTIGDARKFMAYQGYYPLDRFGTLYAVVSKIWAHAWLFLTIAIVSACYLTIKSKTFFTGAHVFFCGALSALVYMAVGPIGLHEYIGVPIQARYYAPVAPPLCLVIAIACSYVSREGRNVLGLLVSSCIVVLLCFVQVLSPAPSAGKMYGSAFVQSTLNATSLIKSRYANAEIYSDPYISRVTVYGLPIALKPGRDAAACATTYPIFYIQRRSKGKEDSYLDAIRACASRNGKKIEDFTKVLSPGLYATRFDGLAAAIGFPNVAAREKSPAITIYSVGL